MSKSCGRRRDALGGWGVVENVQKRPLLLKKGGLSEALRSLGQRKASSTREPLPAGPRLAKKQEQRSAYDHGIKPIDSK